MDRRLRWLAGLVGLGVLLALAWPIDRQPGAAELALLAALTLGASASLRSGARIAPPTMIAPVAVWGLALAALIQRLADPMAGLVILIGASLLVLERRDASAAPAGWIRLTGASVVGFVSLAVPEQVGVPRALALFALAFSGLAALLRSGPALRTSRLAPLLASSPATLLVVSFAGIAATGTALLLLPVASTEPGGLSVVDAAFTAVSATCVTGLIVLDTPEAFTGFGQAVILALIQVGGLGIMAFAAAGSLYLGRRMGLREEALAAEMMGLAHQRRDLEAALRTVLGVTAVSEAVGALALTGLFVHDGDGLAEAAWRGLFTAISAFCNAGFALQSDSLIPYRDNAPVLLVVSALIVVGSLGPLVVVALPRWRASVPTLHVQLVVAATVTLLALPTFGWLVLEWNGALAGLGLTDRFVNAWFQAVTLRTAGFNSIDLTVVGPATWTMMLLCMFIGGSPGSTAGGVKTTTFAVLLLAVATAIRGRDQVQVLGRRLPHRTVYEAAAITTIGVLSAVVTLTALQLTQRISLELALFEVVSALGTVGLSLGATSELDAVGKVVILAAMFMGRVGPLTLFIFLVGRHGTGRKYPFESVPVG